MSNKTLEKPAKKTASAPRPRLTKQIVLTIGIVLSILTFIGTIVMVQRSMRPTTSFGSVNLQLEKVATEDAIIKGLSGRQSLGQNQGMLFVFDKPEVQCFWMKDMNFPLDILWLDADQKVVTIKANVSPDTFPDSFCPTQPAQYVLEVNAGLANSAGVTEGTQLNF